MTEYDWSEPVRAGLRNMAMGAAVWKNLEDQGIEFTQEEKYVGSNILEWDNGHLRWNGKQVAAFIEIPAQSSDPALMGLVIYHQDNGEFTVVRVSRRQISDPWVVFSLVSDLSWADVRHWINEDIDV